MPEMFEYRRLEHFDSILGLFAYRNTSIYYTQLNYILSHHHVVCLILGLPTAKQI